MHFNNTYILNKGELSVTNIITYQENIFGICKLLLLYNILFVNPSPYNNSFNIHLITFDMNI